MCFLFTTVEFSSMSSDRYSNPKPKTHQRDVFRYPNSLKTWAKTWHFWYPNPTRYRKVKTEPDPNPTFVSRTHHYPWVELLDDNDVAIKVSTWIIIACVLILCCYLLPFRNQSPKYENGIEFGNEHKWWKLMIFKIHF